MNLAIDCRLVDTSAKMNRYLESLSNHQNDTADPSSFGPDSSEDSGDDADVEKPPSLTLESLKGFLSESEAFKMFKATLQHLAGPKYISELDHLSQTLPKHMSQVEADQISVLYGIISQLRCSDPFSISTYHSTFFDTNK